MKKIPLKLILFLGLNIFLSNISAQEFDENGKRLYHRSCECVQSVESLNYAPMLGDLATFSEIENFTQDWQLLGKSSVYEGLFYKDLVQSNNHSTQNYNMTLIGFEPIKIEHPNQTFAINLMPCESNLSFFELPIFLNIENISTDIPPQINFTLETYFSNSRFR